jgi:hypothetical protein
MTQNQVFLTTPISADPNKSLRSWDPSAVLLLESDPLPQEGARCLCFCFALHWWTTCLMSCSSNSLWLLTLCFSQQWPNNLLLLLLACPGKSFLTHSTKNPYSGVCVWGVQYPSEKTQCLLQVRLFLLNDNQRNHAWLMLTEGRWGLQAPLCWVTWYVFITNLKGMSSTDFLVSQLQARTRCWHGGCRWSTSDWWPLVVKLANGFSLRPVCTTGLRFVKALVEIQLHLYTGQIENISPPSRANLLYHDLFVGT